MFWTVGIIRGAERQNESTGGRRSRLPQSDDADQPTVQIVSGHSGTHNGKALSPALAGGSSCACG
jgi:hypothetical protein